MKSLETPSTQLSAERRVLGLTIVFWKCLLNKKLLINYFPRTTMGLTYYMMGEGGGLIRGEGKTATVLSEESSLYQYFSEAIISPRHTPKV